MELGKGGGEEGEVGHAHWKPEDELAKRFTRGNGIGEVQSTREGVQISIFARIPSSSKCRASLKSDAERLEVGEEEKEIRERESGVG